MEYYHAVYELAKDVLSVIALTLGVDSRFFKPLTDEAVATMRYLHYPAQPKDQDEKLNRGIGAHTDFGCVTLLLQDEVDGLQVLESSHKTHFTPMWNSQANMAALHSFE